MATLKVKNLFKLYHNAKYISARNVSFEVNPGEIFGFLGINGAGKSTTIKCVTGIIPFTAGKIEICGYDIKDDPYNAKRNFGFVPDNHAVYDKLTGAEYVGYLADLYRVPTEIRKQRFEFLCQKFNIGHAVNNQIMSYSHGMKQKISIIGALIHEPKLWILDEPMVGLDPQSIFEVKEYMKEYAKAGNSVLFSSHNLDTVEKLCDRALIIHGGRVIGEVNLKEYRAKGKSLEDEFITMTQEATKKQNEMRARLREEEDELSKSYTQKMIKMYGKPLAKLQGRKKASRAIQGKIRDEVMAEIEATKKTKKAIQAERSCSVTTELSKTNDLEKTTPPVTPPVAVPAAKPVSTAAKKTTPKKKKKPASKKKPATKGKK